MIVLKNKVTCISCGDTIESIDPYNMTYCSCRTVAISRDNFNVNGDKVNSDSLDFIIDYIDAPKGYVVTNNIKLKEAIISKLQNELFCPCQIKKTEDTLCVCKEMRDSGICKCRLWIKNTEEE